MHLYITKNFFSYSQPTKLCETFLTPAKVHTLNKKYSENTYNPT